MSQYFTYGSDRERPFMGFRLPAEQLAALDEERIKLRQNRSAFVRDAIAAHLQRLRSAAK